MFCKYSRFQPNQSTYVIIINILLKFTSEECFDPDNMLPCLFVMYENTYRDRNEHPEIRAFLGNIAKFFS